MNRCEARILRVATRVVRSRAGPATHGGSRDGVESVGAPVVGDACVCRDVGGWWFRWGVAGECGFWACPVSAGGVCWAGWGAFGWQCCACCSDRWVVGTRGLSGDRECGWRSAVAWSCAVEPRAGEAARGTERNRDFVCGLSCAREGAADASLGADRPRFDLARSGTGQSGRHVYRETVRPSWARPWEPWL